jgi:extradiol dioxygenase family protein
MLTPFHLAIPVADLESCRTFYRETLGFEEGRSSNHWVDFNFFGHQFVIHLDKTLSKKQNVANPVDGKDVPIPHFGVVLKWDDWEKLADRLRGLDIDFIIKPYIRFKGEAGEQATLFFLDPEGNALEFKAFKNLNQVFSK